MEKAAWPVTLVVSLSAPRLRRHSQVNALRDTRDEPIDVIRYAINLTRYLTI